MSDEARETDPIQGEIVHRYGDILEADNRLPNWWLATFYVTIVFAVGYWFYYQGFKVEPGLHEQFAAEQAEAAARSGAPMSPAALVTLSHDAAVVAQGAALFHTNCVSCHGDHAEGRVGPNLTDENWIHGGAPDQIYQTITTGVPAKSMPQWGPILGARGVQAATAFILSIRNTHVAGKPPEGEPYVEGAVAPAAPAAGDAAAPAPDPATAPTAPPQAAPAVAPGEASGAPPAPAEAPPPAPTP